MLSAPVSSNYACQNAVTKWNAEHAEPAEPPISANSVVSALISLLPHVFGQQLLRKRTIASGGSHASVGKSLRKRQKSPQVGRDRETCGNHRQVAPEAISPAAATPARQTAPGAPAV